MLTEDYATKIARDWNAREDNVGYVLRFDVPELWIPAEELDDFNALICERIEVVAEYRS